MNSTLLSPIANADWSPRTARHLLNRAGFGIPRGRAAALAGMAPEEAVSLLVDFDRVPSGFRPPDFITTFVDLSPPAGRGMSPDEQRRARLERVAEERDRVRRLRGWWLQQMAETPRPLEEKLALFWHGHFATSAQKVRSSYVNYHLNDTFRKYAAGNFKELTLAVAQSPAMLRYLDNNRNLKGSPNENWARELMELFTMGPGHYTETDVKESARAFTGWSFRDERFTIRAAQHDDGVKTFLGRTGRFNGYDVIDIIFEQPATAEFIVAKLWTSFAYEHPEPGIVAELAADFRAHEYELRPVLRKILLSRAFYSDRAIGARIKSPVECVLQTTADLGLDNPPYELMAHMTAQLGQDLFFPPNVKGWDGGRAWINANTLLQRYNLPQTLVAANIVQHLRPESDNAMATMRGRGTGRYVRELLASAPPERARHYRLLLQDAAPDERRAIFIEALMEFAPPDAWHVGRAYPGADHPTAQACVDALADRLLARPLTSAQRNQLAQVLAPDGGAPPFRDDNMRAALRLMMSLAEYQLT